MRPFFSTEITSLLMGLLEKDKSLRLGNERDAIDIKNHPFFADIDWNKLENQLITPPYKPPVSDAEKFTYFDPNLQQEWKDEGDDGVPEDTEELFSMDNRFNFNNQKQDSYGGGHQANLENFTYEKENMFTNTMAGDEGYSNDHP